MSNRFFKLWHLHRQPATGIEHKRPAVKNLIVLTTNQIEIDKRQLCLDHTRHHLVEPHIEFVAVIGRAVGNHQHLRATFGHRLANILVPSIFTNWRANAQIPNPIRSIDRANLVVSMLIEHMGVGQVMLLESRINLAALEHEIAVKNLMPFAQRRANAKGRAIRTCRRQLLQMTHAIIGKSRAQHQILHLIATQKHLRQSNVIRPSLMPDAMCCDRFLHVTRQVANGWVQLRQRQSKRCTHQAPAFAQNIGAKPRFA